MRSQSRPYAASESLRLDAGLKGQAAMARVENMAELALHSGELAGKSVKSSIRTLGDMRGLFRDEAARESMDQKTRVYTVQAYFPVAEGQEGGLFWGTTFLEPGLVGDEYFMTKGHSHSNPNRGEFYLTLQGSGALLLMDSHRKIVVEPMSPESLHYIPAHTAHRVTNTGDSLLVFTACWPSDAGHDYASVAREGFSARLRKVGGVPTLVREP